MNHASLFKLKTDNRSSSRKEKPHPNLDEAKFDDLLRNKNSLHVADDLFAEFRTLQEGCSFHLSFEIIRHAF